MPANRYPRTGGQFARELLDGLGLHHVGTETTTAGDHYDPISRTVRLSEANYTGRSLTAVTIAAHEVGHAIQDARGFKPLRWRTRLVKWVGPIEKLGAGILMLSPLAAVATRAPVIGLLTLTGGFLTLASGAAVHLLTLPTEFDASFGPPCPCSPGDGYFAPATNAAPRRLLTAAAPHLRRRIPGQPAQHRPLVGDS